MAEALSVIASVVQFADVACRVSRDVYTFMSALKDAPNELRRLHQRAKELMEILFEIKTLAEAYKNSTLLTGNENIFDTLKEVLKSCTDDLRLLQKAIPVSNNASDKSFLRQLQKGFKTVFKGKEITKVSQRLDNQKASLSNIISIIGRRNDLRIYENIQSTVNEAHGFRSSLLSQSNTIQEQVSIEAEQAKIRYNLLHQEIAKSSSNANTHCSDVTQRLSGIVQGQSNTEARIIHANTQTMNRFDDISESQHHLCTALNRSISNTQEQLANMSNCQNSIKTGIEQLLCLDSLQISVAGEKSAPSITFQGSPIQAIQSLSHICPHVYGLISEISVGSQPEKSLELARWLDSELQGLFQCAITAATQNQACNPTKGHPDGQPLHWRGSSTQMDMALTPRDRLYRSRRLKKLAFRRAQAAGRISLTETVTELQLPTGRLVIATSENCVHDNILSRDDLLAIGARLLFIPDAKFRVSGLAASFVRTFDQNPVVAPSISVFRVLPYDSPIFSYIKSRNISGVRSLLARGQASPRDRNPAGYSLLYYAIWYFDYNICSLLLREGSDAFDCDREGRSALTILITGWRELGERQNISENQILDATRLFIKYCGVDGALVVYRWNLDSLEYDDDVSGPIHQAVAAGKDYSSSLLLMVQSGGDIEERNFGGNTPLLYALYQAQRQDALSNVQALLNAGADPLAINYRGHGALSMFLSRLSACNDYTMDSIHVKALVNIIVRLLGAGCDPSLSSFGFTPSNYALAPVAWVIWCKALECVGFDVESVLREDDIRCGVALSDHYVDEKFLEASEYITNPLPQTTANNGSDLVVA
ncbi:ankyrin [Glonium stellatum]|uniref:Ankyrin n=1 Tax=Glonium stellatum TaxID=574774 RepID=A0A8E2FEH4_9PEZI|nr:ankyrin [Glonium stellatum]